MIDFYEEEDFSRTVFIINDEGEIEENELGDLCRDFAETTTTPKGVLPKAHIREMSRWRYDGQWFDSEEDAIDARDLDVERDYNGGAIEEAPRYELWAWGYAGNSREFVEGFDTEQEANHALLLWFRYDLYNGSNSPDVYDTREEAEAALKELEE